MRKEWVLFPAKFLFAVSRATFAAGLTAVSDACSVCVQVTHVPLHRGCTGERHSGKLQQIQVMKAGQQLQKGQE